MNKIQEIMGYKHNLTPASRTILCKGEIIMSTTTRRMIPALAAVVLAASIPVHARAAYKATATTICRTKSNVNVRRGPGMKYSVKKLIRKGSTVKKVGTSGSWSAIKVQGSTCYIKSAYLKTCYKYMYISGDNVNIRSGPGKNYKVCAVLPRNTKVKYYNKSKGWMKIKYKEKVCYVSTPYLSSKKTYVQQTTNSPSLPPSEPTTPTAPPTVNPALTNAEIRSRAISYAHSRLGDTYSQQYRNRPGYADCSSLMRDVFLSASGVNIGENTSSQQVILSGYKKSLNNLQPGDLLFHAEPGSNHVGLYIGNNQYIHASYTRGKVIVSNYYHGVYWTDCYDAAAFCAARQH